MPQGRMPRNHDFNRFMGKFTQDGAKKDKRRVSAS